MKTLDIKLNKPVLSCYTLDFSHSRIKSGYDIVARTSKQPLIFIIFTWNLVIYEIRPSLESFSKLEDWKDQIDSFLRDFEIFSTSHDDFMLRYLIYFHLRAIYGVCNNKTFFSRNPIIGTKTFGSNYGILDRPKYRNFGLSTTNITVSLNLEMA